MIDPELLRKLEEVYMVRVGGCLCCNCRMKDVSHYLLETKPPDEAVAIYEEFSTVTLGFVA